jgi:histidinol-phosphatase (PHP family)
LEYADAPELFDELFSVLVADNKAIEINTRRLDDQKAIDALVALYKRFAELGGKYCTLGSDAHYAEHVGRRMDVALEIAKECGLTPVYFKNREMQIIEL